MDVQSAEYAKAYAHIWSQAFSFANCASIKCAVQLGMPDVIANHGKAMTLSELTQALQIKPSKAPHLLRLMRILVNAGFFSEEPTGDVPEGMTNVYGLTPLSRILLKNEPLNLRGFALLMFDPIQLEAWNALSEWFRNEVPTAFETAHGKSYWDCVAEEPRRFKMLAETSATDSELVTKYLVTEYRFLFEGLTSVVDVGCGTGEVAKAIAESFPSMKCTMFDEPYVVDKPERRENLDVVAGSIFEKIPPADALILKWMLHNWNDEDCVKILKNCKKAIPKKQKGGKVIIIDPISKMNDSDAVNAQISVDMDMNTQILFGTKVRSEKEWATLFQEAGFSDYKVFPFLDIRGIIEVYP